MSSATPAVLSAPSRQNEAYFLVGPTAVGKSAAAQLIAERTRAILISADSMQVYRGMDIGTAKPSAAERARVPHWGVDIVNPDVLFSVADYLRAVAGAFEIARGKNAPVLVVGGTGLYVKCLIEGLSDAPGADPASRRRAEAMIEAAGVPALQAALREADPVRYAALKDPDNPRRLVRAYELACMKAPPAVPWRGPPEIPLAGLAMRTAALRERISQRVAAMYAAGLIEEARGLRTAFPALSKTALQAIGYAEAFECADGKISRLEAIERSAVRTRQLAKRQMTWFRRQAKVEWIERAGPESPAETAERILEVWKKYGPVPVKL